MKSEWKKEICSSRPEQFQRVADNVYIQRKDIEKVSHKATDSSPAYEDYECMSRRISDDVYEALVEEMNSLTYDALKKQLDNQDVVLAETAVNAEYCVCLQELSL